MSADSIPSEIRWRLSSPNRFTSGPIGPDAFDWLVTRGWASDGSSASLDDIMGVRIGASGNRYDDAHLPANRHDCFYELGRLFRLSPPFRAAADADYRDRCIEAVNSHLIGWRQHAGVARAHARYRTLRAFGGCAWKAKPAAKLVAVAGLLTLEHGVDDPGDERDCPHHGNQNRDPDCTE